MKKIKVVYNNCFGGFSFSRKATDRLAQLGIQSAQETLDKKDSLLGFHYSTDWSDIPRHDERLVQVVEELGDEASGQFADLRVATLRGNRYRIDEYDGNESVDEPDDIGWIVVS